MSQLGQLSFLLITLTRWLDVWFERKAANQCFYSGHCTLFSTRMEWLSRTIFGNDVIPSLDLFHAIQRITRTLPRFEVGVAERRQALTWCFHEPGKAGQRCTLRPASEIIHNLDAWLEMYGPSEETQHQTRNLVHHLVDGCLDNPDRGTTLNESKHRWLRAKAHRHQISVEVGCALIAMFLHEWNVAQAKKYGYTNLYANPHHVPDPSKALESALLHSWILENFDDDDDSSVVATVLQPGFWVVVFNPSEYTTLQKKIYLDLLKKWQ